MVWRLSNDVIPAKSAPDVDATAVKKNPESEGVKMWRGRAAGIIILCGRWWRDERSAGELSFARERQYFRNSADLPCDGRNYAGCAGC